MFVAVLGQGVYDRSWFLTSLRTSSGRILLAWSELNTRKMVFSYSDDNGQTWADTTKFSELSVFSNCNFSELLNGKIILSWDDFTGIRVKYYESDDDGTTWSNEAVTFHSGAPVKKNVTFAQMSSEMLAVFEYQSGIYYQSSTDNGLTWSDEILIVNSSIQENNPRVVKFSEENLLIVYQVDENPQSYFSPGDIYSIKTSNGGETWTEPEQFTSYVGDDSFVKAAKYGDNTLITFTSTRFTNKPQISYAIIGETVESFRPPYITNVIATSDSLSGKHWLISANVIDDEEVVKVSVTFNDGSNAELFDDGLHNDGGANDSLFANVVLLNSLEPSIAGKIDVNKLTLPFTNKGIIADTWISFSQRGIVEATDNIGQACKFETDIEERRGAGSVGRFEEGGFLFSGGFILSGYSNGEMWSNAVASAMLVEDYLPGNVGSDQNDPLNKIYIVYKDDPPFGNSWQFWKDAVSLGAEFYDGDGDGIYNPVDKNWNGTWDLNEDMPMILGDVTAWCVFNDGFPKEMRRWNTVDPQGIEVRQTIFASVISELENVIFLRYSILNNGTVAEIIDSVFWGIWEDGDLGDATDDVVGCDTLLQSGFYYGNRDDYVYGDNPPAFFSAILQGPVVSSNDPSDIARNNFGEMIGSSSFESNRNLEMYAHRFYVGGVPGLSDPNTAVEARNELLGKTSNGQFPNPCVFAWGEVRGGINCQEVNPRFWFSGDPVSDIGWISSTAVDTRNLVSTGPFQLEKDKPQEIIIAYIIGRGTDPLSSVTVARENVQRAIQEYQSNFASMTYTPPAPTNPVNSYVLYQNYPNPFNPTTTIRYELPQDGVVTIEVFDILGQKVKTIINEFQKADRYEVTFSAKGGSASGGNSAGLASGVYIYQLRVNDFITSKKMVLLR